MSTALLPAAFRGRSRAATGAALLLASGAALHLAAKRFNLKAKLEHLYSWARGANHEHSSSSGEESHRQEPKRCTEPKEAEGGEPVAPQAGAVAPAVPSAPVVTEEAPEAAVAKPAEPAPPSGQAA